MRNVENSKASRLNSDSLKSVESQTPLYDFSNCNFALIERNENPTPVVPCCRWCGTELSEDQVATHFGKKKTKFCTPKCRMAFHKAKSNTEVKKVRAKLTEQVDALTGVERDDFLLSLFKRFVLYRIGKATPDGNKRLTEYRVYHAVSNSKLGKKSEEDASSPKTVYNYFIAFANKNFPFTDKRLFDREVLTAFAVNRGWVEAGFVGFTADVMPDAEDDATEEFTEAPVIEVKSTPKVVAFADYMPSEEAEAAVEAPAPQEPVEVPAPVLVMPIAQAPVQVPEQPRNHQDYEAELRNPVTGPILRLIIEAKEPVSYQTLFSNVAEGERKDLSKNIYDMLKRGILKKTPDYKGDYFVDLPDAAQQALAALPNAA